MQEKQVMVVGLDDSAHSFYALEWTLDHFFTPPQNGLFKLIVVHAKTAPSTVIATPMAFGTADIIPLVDADLKRVAQRVVDKAKEVCEKKSVPDVEVEVMEGDARNVMCEAVEKFHASVLVLGSHGYGAFKRAVLGSVSDYCSHHANSTVMIVKQPKTTATSPK
ncbi:universal stress protein PHOS34-like [Cornus florida]|uniref:universal stress protein PHOS34-like n=1 Tax=Cornus florida TaxID=4283 RepID=UPI00289F8A70|nr:universal stress protein PHOS34-like [Cornus florida]